MKRDDLNAVCASASATCSACGRAARITPEHVATAEMLRVRKNCGCAGGVDVLVPETPGRSLKREVVRG